MIYIFIYTTLIINQCDSPDKNVLLDILNHYNISKPPVTHVLETRA